MKIKQLNNETTRLLRMKLQEHFDKIEEEIGVAIRLGNMRYSDKTARSKVEMSLVEPGESPDKNIWNFHCRRYGLLPEHYDKQISINGRLMRLKTIRSSAKKYPIICEDTGGHRWKYTARAIQNALQYVEDE